MLVPATVSIRHVQLRAVGVACLVAATSLTSGCKTGSSMSSSWLGLGMGGPDPATLAEAPPFEGDLSKPSATAKPYPTTSTPESYALQQGQPAEAPGQPADTVPQMAAAPQAPITYGSTPPPPQAPVAAQPTAVASTPVTTQVGPYQQVPTTTTPPAAAAPAAAVAADAAVGYQASASSRFSQAAPPAAAADGYGQPSGRFSPLADQRVAEAQPTAASGTAAFGSRFSRPEAAAATGAAFAQAGTEESRYGTADSGGRYGAQSDSAFGAPAAGTLTPPIQPAGSPPAQQSSAPATESLPAPPTSQRPDPGYRPGGTSSYRKAQPIYADAPMSIPATAAAGELPGMDGGVSPASFEAELGTPHQPLP